MGDLVDALLRLITSAIARQDKAIADQASRLGRELDTLHEAVKAYLARLDRSDLTERDVIRLSDIIEFAVNVGHAGDILERRIVQAAANQDAITSALDRGAILRIHSQVAEDLKLALSTLMTEDARSAREVVDAKRAVNDAERAASRDHLARLGGSDEGEGGLGRSNAVLVMLRDLKLVNSHLANIGYALIEPREGVTTRLTQSPLRSRTIDRPVLGNDA